MTRVRVTRNYQMTIPREVRSKLKLRVGDVVEVEAVDAQRVVLKRIISLEQLEGAWDGEMDRVMEEVRKVWRGGKLPNPYVSTRISSSTSSASLGEGRSP